jgi:hypothetical protein
MPWYRVAGSVMHIRVDRRQAKKWAKDSPPCPFFVMLNVRDEHGRIVEKRLARCMAFTTRLCDWLGCNRPMCEQHAAQLVPGFDFCPTHNSRRGLFSRLLPSPMTKSPMPERSDSKCPVSGAACRRYCPIGECADGVPLLDGGKNG